MRSPSRDDDDFGLVELRVAEDLPDRIAMREAQKQPARLAEQPAERRAAGADRRRVDDRQQLLDVLPEQRIEQRFVGILKIAQEGVALEIGGEFAKRLQAAANLILDIHHRRRQQAVQTESVALLVGKGGAFVEAGVGQQLIAGEVRRHDHGLVGLLRLVRHARFRP